MRQQSVRIKSIKLITHDVLQIVTEKPRLFNFRPGQSTEISVNKNSWKAEKRSFSFTSLPENDFLEFIIKTYPMRKSVTNKLLELEVNDELMLHEVFGEIEYKGEGIFIAGGAGITPFISIFRDLKSKNKIGDNKLIYANNTKADVILASELKAMLGRNFTNILAHDIVDGYEHGLINEIFLKKYILETGNYIYLCGPPLMVESLEKQLAKSDIGEKLIIKEAS